MESNSGLNSELESFRQQWLSDLRRNNPAQASSSSTGPSTARSDPPPRRAHERKPLKEDDDYYQPKSFDEPSGSDTAAELGHKSTGKAAVTDPVSALDHYEAAVEKESLGSLGDSLKLYRQAFKLDSRVDQIYRKKHFPLLAQKPASSSTGQASSASAPSKPSHQRTDGQTPTFKDLIAAFSTLSIEASPPAIEGTPAPPCPISRLPDELLVHVLRDLAVADVADFARLSLVCKKFAFLVATEQRAWRRVCLGDEVGFLGMHYRWQCGISWEPLDEDEIEDEYDEDDDDLPAKAIGFDTASKADLARRRQREQKLATTLALLPTLYNNSWQDMFRRRPRIRFNGCYISTNNYMRPGQASVSQVSWNSPVHIVTYYRYLRFFRDGSAISLLTTDEPPQVVHHLTRDALSLHRRGEHLHLPSSAMHLALRGRWRLSSAADGSGPDSDGLTSSGPNPEAEADLTVETESSAKKDKYTFRLELSLRSAGRGARNNKLIWRAHYSHNRITDDWAEFGLKNDKPYFFSRVKSYGAGE